jgi:hypothetical protein
MLHLASARFRSRGGLVVYCEAIPATALPHKSGQRATPELVGVAVDQSLLVDQSSRDSCVATGANVYVDDLKQLQRIFLSGSVSLMKSILLVRDPSFPT